MTSPALRTCYVGTSTNDVIHVQRQLKAYKIALARTLYKGITHFVTPAGKFDRPMTAHEMAYIKDELKRIDFALNLYPKSRVTRTSPNWDK